MRLLFYIYSLLPGGAERVTVTLCNELANNGFEIYLATNTRLPFAYNPHSNIHLIEMIPEKGIFHNSLTHYFRLQKNIRRIARKVKPDVITSSNYILNVHVILATTGIKIPVISWEHTTFDKRHLFYQYIIRFWINRFATKVVILTQYDFEFLGEKLPSKIVIPNPLSFPIYHGKMTDRKKNILAVGSIDSWKIKGFDNLIKVWSKLEGQYPEWLLEIAGGGSEKCVNCIRSIAREYGVEHRVQFLGLQKEIDKVMRESTVFILTSRFEGFPLVLVEAMSQGCACISFDCITGPREIITHDRNGLLIKDQDLDEMSTNLNTLLSDEELRNKLSINAINDIEHLTPQRITKKWISVFNEVIRE